MSTGGAARGGPGRLAAGAALALALGMLCAPLAGHGDDGDAQLYTVVVRNLAADGTWLQLRYLPAVYPRFFEHLPFGFWPFALAVRHLGEAALGPLCVLLSLGTVALTGWLGARLAGRWAGVTAVLVLALTEGFFITGGRMRLDVPLLLLTTASVAPLLAGEWTRGRLALAAGLAALAALVKGPFGLLPLAAVVAAEVLVQRSWPRAVRRTLEGATALALAALPLGLFLGLDRAGGGPWWPGYVEGQLLASATGARQDGSLGALFPLRALAGRFWPGLLLLPLGVWRARRPGETGVRRLLLACLVLLVLLCLPARKLWHHTLILYPLLAALAGAGLSPLLSRWLAAGRRERGAALALAVLALLVLGLAAGGVGAQLLPRPCLVHRELALPLAALAPGTRLAVVAPRPPWELLAQLAAERGLHPEPVARLEEARGVSLVLTGGEVELPSGWTRRGEARGWRLWQRD